MEEYLDQCRELNEGMATTDGRYRGRLSRDVQPGLEVIGAWVVTASECERAMAS
jgi:hypothetical protein